MRWCLVRSKVKLGAAVLATIALWALLVWGLAGCSEQPSGPAGPEGAAATTPAATTSTTEPAVEITIAAVGDVMCHKEVRQAALVPGTKDEYDFRPLFTLIAPYLRAADYTVGNLETRLAGDNLAFTSYPRFNSPGALADALVWSGFDLVATANNHTLDKRWWGVENTLNRLDEAGIAHVGTHRSQEEKDAGSPLLVDIEGIKVAFINYTDYLNEFTPPREHKDYAVNFYRKPDKIAEEAAIARQKGAELVIAILHWGREYRTWPDDTEVEFAQGSDDYPGLLALGVDVILGGHPHVCQPIVHVPRDGDVGVKNAYVVYSLGNFVSGMEGRRTQGGVIVYLHIRKTGSKVDVTGIDYMGVYVQNYGPYPRKMRILPLLPGLDLGEGVWVDARDQQRIGWLWEALTEMYDRPEQGVAPLDPAELDLTGG
jgi:poly-gamma-glutamate capsule biosynthesis protein CapA/YwtB (metallophosphatase superfamily)